jgi:hypothetical protein
VVVSQTALTLTITPITIVLPLPMLRPYLMVLTSPIHLTIIFTLSLNDILLNNALLPHLPRIKANKRIIALLLDPNKFSKRPQPLLLLLPPLKQNYACLNLKKALKPSLLRSVHSQIQCQSFNGSLYKSKWTLILN